MIAYLDQQARLLSQAGVDILLNTSATPELARSVAPDVILAALGARPVIPNIPGIQLPHVQGAEAVYLAPDSTGERVIILGGGLVGIELAYLPDWSGPPCNYFGDGPSTVCPRVFHAFPGSSFDQIDRCGISVHLSTPGRGDHPHGDPGPDSGRPAHTGGGHRRLCRGPVAPAEKKPSLWPAAPQSFICWGTVSPPKTSMRPPPSPTGSPAISGRL